MQALVSANPEAAAQTTVFAKARLDALHFAVPTESVVQALARPAQLTPLPRASANLDGVFLYRGRLVPVVNLAHWMSPGTLASRPAAQVLVLQQGDRTIGVGVDAVQGLLKAAPGAIQQVHRDDDPQELFHSVATAEDGATLVPLLDIPRLMAQVQVWAGAQDSQAYASGDAAAASATGPRTAKFALVRSGGALYGVPVADVGEVTASPQVQPIVGGAAGLAGVARWRDRHIPVLALQAAPAPAVGTLPPAWMLVLRDDRGCIGLPIQEMCAVRDFACQHLQATQGELATLCPQTVLTDEGERVYLVDTQAFLASCPLSGMDTSSAAKAFGLRTGISMASPHIVLRAGRLFAAPLADMQEIVRVPAHMHALDSLDGQQIEWRGQPLPLRDVRQRLDDKPTTPGGSSRIVVVALGAALVGAVVEEVVALLPAHAGVLTRFSMRGHPEAQMVTVGQGEAQKSYSIQAWESLLQA